MSSLSDDILEKAREELGETEEKRQSALTELRRRIEEDSDIPPTLDENALLMFLRPKKFDVDRAFTLLKTFLNFKDRFKEVGGDLLLEHAVKSCQNEMHSMIPNSDGNGTLLLIYRMRNYDIKQFQYTDIWSAPITIAMAYMYLYPEGQISGVQCISDARGCGINQVLSIKLNVVKCIFRELNSAPIRLKGMYFLNDSTVASKVIKFMRPNMSEKIQNRVHFYGPDERLLLNHFKLEHLPKEFGGDLICDKNQCMETLEKFRHTPFGQMILANESQLV